MSKKLLYLLGILLTLIIGTILYWHFCCRCQNKSVGQEPPPALVTGKYLPFNVNGLGYNCMENFNFLKGGIDHLLPPGDSLNQGIGLLTSHFNTLTGKKLLITGYCLPDEKETPDFPHLGYARAMDIKNFLTGSGFNPSSIEIRGKIENDWRMQGDTLLGPAGFEIVDLTALPDSITRSDWASFKETVNGNPVTLYFDSGQSENDSEQTVMAKIAALVNYLGNVAEGAVEISGHTDNAGSHALNMLLGQRRADFVKSILVKNGMDGHRITTSSKGPDEPAGDNASPEGRAKNRRAVIIIQ
jgi:OmpA-OmpF porin, OOP family